MSKYISTIFLIFCITSGLFAEKKSVLLTDKRIDGPKDSIDYYLVNSEKLLDSLPIVAFKMAERGKIIAEYFEMVEQEAYASKIMGESKLNQEEYYEASKYLTYSLDFYRNTQKKDILGDIYYLLGLTEYYLTSYSKSIAYNLEASSIFRALDKQQDYANSLQNIGLVYHSLNMLDKALEYYRKALEINLRFGKKDNIAGIYQNLGIVSFNKKNDSLAFEYYGKSIEYYREINDLKGIGITYSNIGLIYLDKKQTDKALINFEKSFNFFNKTGFRLGQMWALNNLGSALAMQGEIIKAKKYFYQSLNLAFDLSNAEGILTNYSDLKKYYEQLGDYKTALIYSEKYSVLKDSLNANNSKDKIAELETLYKLENKEKEAAQLDSELKKQRTHKYAIVGFLSLLILALIVILSAYYQKRNAEIKLSEHKVNLEKLVEKRTKELQHQIGERKIAEESDKLKSAFLANMSHELRTPMNAIIAFSNFLREPDLSNERRVEYIEHITSASDSLLGLIDDIIDIAKIESKQLKIYIQPTNINRLLTELYKIFSELRLKLNKKHIHFNLKIDNEFSYIINTDSQRLKQVITNLIENAFKYTDKGKIEVGFETNNNTVSFFVSDTGIGIPADKHEAIFNRFYQLNQMNDRRNSGTGLGLAICKNLIQLLGGNILVDSEPGVGSVFTIKIPVDSIKKQPNPTFNEDLKPIPQKKKSVYNWNNITILVAEDEDLNYKVLDTCLARTNANIIRAKDGIAAVEIFKNQKIDVVLMDIQMPGMDGYEATQEIKKINNRTPVIAQTSFALVGEKEKCLQAGCDDFITKPLNIELLLKKIEAYLR